MLMKFTDDTKLGGTGKEEEVWDIVQKQTGLTSDVRNKIGDDIQSSVWGLNNRN